MDTGIMWVLTEHCLSMERHRTDIESMRMVSGFRNKEELNTEPPGRKDRGGSVFHSSVAAKRPAAQLAEGVDVIIV